MKLNWDKTIIDIEGKVVKADKDNDMTLGKMAITSLVQLVQGDQNLTGLDKYKMGALAYKIKNEPNEELTEDEVQLIKDRIGILYSTFLVYQAYNAIYARN